MTIIIFGVIAAPIFFVLAVGMNLQLVINAVSSEATYREFRLVDCAKSAVVMTFVFIGFLVILLSFMYGTVTLDLFGLNETFRI